MFSKHFLKTLVGFVGIILLGLISLMFINQYDKSASSVASPSAINDISE